MSGVEISEACRQYSAAYSAHYVERDLPLALELYRRLMESHPSTQESGYCRMQIRNIVSAVVSDQELMDAQIDLVLRRFEGERLE